jgi:hypothetical protein
MRAQFIILALLGAQIFALAQFQGPTLAERVATERTDVAVTINVDGPHSVFERTIGATDLVVRGQVGKATGHLTEDGRDIYTTYEILNPQVFFAARVQQLPWPGIAVPLTFTQRGGTVEIAGHKASVSYDNVAKVRAGMEVILLLHERDGKNWPAGAGGIFEVQGSKVVPLSPQPGDHRKFDGVDANSFLSEVARKRRELTKQ